MVEGCPRVCGFSSSFCFGVPRKYRLQSKVKEGYWVCGLVWWFGLRLKLKLRLRLRLRFELLGG